MGFSQRNQEEINSWVAIVGLESKKSIPLSVDSAAYITEARVSELCF